MVYDEDTTKSYRIKDIKFLGSPRRILLQSANGPCPLLAICNVLLLRNQLNIPRDLRYIDFDQLVEMVSNRLFDANSASSGGDSNSSRAANVQQHLSSCLEVLPRLNVGLDVNCRFSGPTEFEFTQELSVFDLLDINLFHGWVVSHQDENACAAFAHLSYNQVVEKLIAFEEARIRMAEKSGAAQQERGDEAWVVESVHASPQGVATPTAEGMDADPTAAADGVAAEAPPPDSAKASVPDTEEADPETAKLIHDGKLIKEFMDRTASQLSYDGLLALHEVVKERELAVFFRNSHFSAMLKYSGELYLLCTDIAFANSHVVWERLDEVDGDTSYCDADFQVNRADSDEAAALAAAEAAQETAFVAEAAGLTLPGATQVDSDALYAMQLMQQDLQQQAVVQASAPGTRSSEGGSAVAHAAAAQPAVAAPAVSQSASAALRGTAEGSQSNQTRAPQGAAGHENKPKGKPKGKFTVKSCALQ